MQYAMSHTGAEAINLGTGRGTSVLELVETFQRVNGVEVPYVIAPRRDGDLASYYADATEAWELLHWKTELSVEDMCRDSWRWESTQRAE